MTSDLTGRTVVVTGGARGIGRATAAALARRGARVAIGDIDGDLAERAAGELDRPAFGGELDVTDERSFGDFLDRAADALGEPDVLVNNAGVLIVGRFADQDAGDAARMIDVNLGGVVTGTRLAIRRFLAGQGGHIVNVASASSYVAPPGEATYGATKHAVRALTDAVRDEVEPLGIRMTAVFPGFVDTELAAGTVPSRGQKLIAPEQVGEAIAAAIVRPRAEVFVPRSLGMALRLHAALPPRARRTVGRLFGVDKVATATDPAKRLDYMSRVTERRG